MIFLAVMAMAASVVRADDDCCLNGDCCHGVEFCCNTCNGTCRCSVHGKCGPTSAAASSFFLPEPSLDGSPWTRGPAVAGDTALSQSVGFVR